MDRLIPLLKDLHSVETEFADNLLPNPSVGLAEELLSPKNAAPNENITEPSYQR